MKLSQKWLVDPSGVSVKPVEPAEGPLAAGLSPMSLLKMELGLI
jgi:hypothetical protein